MSVLTGQQRAQVDDEGRGVAAEREPVAGAAAHAAQPARRVQRPRVRWQHTDKHI